MDSETLQNKTNGRFFITAQYVKDLSFENPNALQALFSLKDRPRIDLKVNLKAQSVGDMAYELTIQTVAKATAQDLTVFLADLEYAAVVTLNNVAEHEREQVLMVEAPMVIFPFVRRVIADITRDGGFPPLLLEPVDFRALFEQQKKAA